jgi:hypothetical protein
MAFEHVTLLVILMCEISGIFLNLTRVILDRIQDTVEQRLRKEQAGFRKHRGCVDLINTLRIILEQSVE